MPTEKSTVTYMPKAVWIALSVGGGWVRTAVSS